MARGEHELVGRGLASVTVNKPSVEERQSPQRAIGQGDGQAAMAGLAVVRCIGTAEAAESGPLTLNLLTIVTNQWQKNSRHT